VIQAPGDNSCDLETYAEWYNPLKRGWEAVPQNDFVTPYLGQENLYISIQMSQKMFIESVAPAFGYDTTYQPPPSISIEVQFITVIQANPENR
jgi:hypothetical protein